LEATAEDVALVVAGGVVRVADPSLGAVIDEVGLDSEPMTIRGVTRRVCRETASHVTAGWTSISHTRWATTSGG
jgi:hypothetical protein